MSHLGSNYYDCNMDDEIGLEPRLLEYIRKKKFFKENNIEIDFLDKEFAITKTDISKIKAYIKGDKNNYINAHSDIVDMSKATFPSSELKKDPRLERIKTKQKKETDANEQRHDYGIISKSYDMYRDDRPFASASGNDFSKSDFHPDQWLQNSRNDIMDENIVKSQKSFYDSNTYVNPRSSYNSYLDRNTTIKQDSHTINEIIGKLDTYTKSAERIPKRDSDWGVNLNGKTECENNYRALPLMSSNSNLINNNLDIDVDSHMRFGNTPLRAGKSLGYPSVLEHAFSYISSDIQDPNHVVMDRGVPSRAFNKETARPSAKRDPMR